ncbi:acetyltransferase [Gracilibacillus salitolerans]|uniref:Acetyltransferase n=1 Tax=Gracilibacillus salitolerans TaxID=2663022 RepID=A0A5Q2TV67_9BACI|nr:DapH/DapD/GlmU-related protein [Gracilibacillus salitolerans]QGH36708.1 acetyltransferase [Gracilibacillus salitolerans]
MSHSISSDQKRLTKNPAVHHTATVTDSTLGDWTDIGPDSKVIESQIGEYSYTAGDAQIIYATIGKFCSIASHVRINPGNHPTWRVTQHHATYRMARYGFSDEDDHEFFDWRRSHPVHIGHDVWIGHNAVIMPGVTVGNGAVIGTGAIVTKDVDPYTMVAGVPAKWIKDRFSAEEAAQLQEIAWWDWSREVLEERFQDLNNMARFLTKYGAKNRDGR